MDIFFKLIINILHRTSIFDIISIKYNEMCCLKSVLTLIFARFLKDIVEDAAG